MKQKVDPTKCRYFNDPSCPGQNLDLLMMATKAIIVEGDGKGTYGSDVLNFIKKHGCSSCEKHKS